MAREWPMHDITSQAHAAIDVSSTAGELLQTTDSRVTRVADAAGAQLRSAAEALRQRAPAEGVWGKAATALADRVEGTGTYLQEVNLAAMEEDLVAMIRRYPVQTLVIGASIGFLLGRRGR